MPPVPPAAPEPAPGVAVPAEPRRGSGRHAFLVAAGILLSRVVGLVRQRVFAHALGSGVVAGVFSAALRIPNLLQNMLGEGILSSSFIPVYAHLLARGEREEAEHVAGAVAGLLTAVTALLVVAGILAAPALVQVITPGLSGAEQALAIRFVRILFPATATLVLSAWCLGILNSHHRFFLSYAAPVANNVAVIAVLVAGAGRVDDARLGGWVAWGYVVGAVLQVGVQVPSVLALVGRLRPSISVARQSVRTVLGNFAPALVGRGVVQLSAFVDTIYASYVGTRGLATLGYQQTLYLLPISLFGMAISASELPAMSAAVGTPAAVAAALRTRLDAALQRLAFFVVPSAAAFVAIGDVLAGALFQTGKQTAADTRYLWLVLMGSAVGLVAAAKGRVYASSFYALRDTRTPLRFAVVRLALTASLAWWSAVKMPDLLGVPREAGLVGITATTGLAAWVEYALLRRALARRIGKTGVPGRRMALLWGAAAVAGGAALATKVALVRWRGAMPGLASDWGGAFLPPPRMHPVLAALPIVGAFAVVYLGLVLVLTPGGAAALPGFRRRVRR
ncbi:murein biosynthesis integral membrane protein MurJ [Anaeromyxobacter oryzae]|uniref:murein biosynthesis integral membrane protein MurJ n=1 Tax=Anaeromyxobacter oryzae TaxID=2918170 RepID=UPI0020BDB22B|nr:murein biosynthesis integral membrane protein MurJ [Anaeromyxobacter oryzae]